VVAILVQNESNIADLDIYQFTQNIAMAVYGTSDPINENMLK
jgi:hypothetical protein